jgi:CDP-diacylglycerol--serine O-phosphatidyltransferase
MEGFKKWSYFLPNIFTAMNMSCGFVSVMLTIQGNYYGACVALILGAIFDSVDGRIARLTGTQSSFGEQFDSLSDLVSFGMAPAILYYYKFLLTFDRIGMVVSFLFLLCTALRLARFNANLDKISSNFFQGLPSPMGAMGIVGFTLLTLKFQILNKQTVLVFFNILFYSFLMISNIPFTSFKNSSWVQKHKNWSLLILLILFLSVFVYEYIMISLILTVYVISSFVYFAFNRKKLPIQIESKHEP